MEVEEKPTILTVPEEVREIKRDMKLMNAMMFALLEIVNQKANEEIWLTIEPVSKLTNLKEQTIRTKVMLNEIPSHKIGGKRMFKKSEVLEWLNQGGGKRYE